MSSKPKSTSKSTSQVPKPEQAKMHEPLDPKPVLSPPTAAVHPCERPSRAPRTEGSCRATTSGVEHGTSGLLKAFRVEVHGRWLGLLATNMWRVQNFKLPSLGWRRQGGHHGLKGQLWVAGAFTTARNTSAEGLRLLGLKF